jgi:hypothetical protein
MNVDYRAQRTPSTLQNVFLASNRGNDIHKPPPEKVASKTFFSHNWFFSQKKSSMQTHKVSSNRRVAEEDQKNAVSPSLQQTKVCSKSRS